MEKPSVLIVGADSDVEARLFGTLRDVAKVVGAEPPSVERALESYRRYTPGLVIVAVTFDPETSADLIRELTAAGANVIVEQRAHEAIGTRE